MIYSQLCTVVITTYIVTEQSTSEQMTQNIIRIIVCSIIFRLRLIYFYYFYFLILY